MYKDSMTEQAAQIVCRWWPRMCTGSISMCGWWSTGSCAHLPGPRSRSGVCGRLLEQVYRSRAHSRIASGTGAGCLTSPLQYGMGQLAIYIHTQSYAYRETSRAGSPRSAALLLSLQSERTWPVRKWLRLAITLWVNCVMSPC